MSYFETSQGALRDYIALGDYITLRGLRDYVALGDYVALAGMSGMHDYVSLNGLGGLSGLEWKVVGIGASQGGLTPVSFKQVDRGFFSFSDNDTGKSATVQICGVRPPSRSWKACWICGK